MKKARGEFKCARNIHVNAIAAVGLMIVAAVVCQSVETIEQLSGQSLNLICTQSNPSWFFTPDGGTKGTAPGTPSGTALTITSPIGNKEGLYTCEDNGNILKTFNLTILALAKFVGCQSQDLCNNNQVYMRDEGQSIVINITAEFYGGGSRNKKQNINFIFLNDPSSKTIVSCSDSNGGCSSLVGGNKVTFTIEEQHNVQLLINNLSLSDEGEYRARLRVEKSAGLTEELTSIFTISVMTTTTTTTLTTTTTMPLTISSSIVVTSVASSPYSTPIISSSSSVPGITSTSISISNSISSDSVSTVGTSTMAMPTTTSQSKSTLLTTSASTATSLVDPSLDSIKDGGNLDSHYVALIVIVAILSMLVIVASFIVVATCAVSRRKRQVSISGGNEQRRTSNLLNITYIMQWISIFRGKEGSGKSSKEGSVDAVLETPLTGTKDGQPTQHQHQQQQHEVLYSTIRENVEWVYDGSYDAQITCTSPGVYAKVKFECDFSLDQTPNSKKFTV